MRDFHRGGAAEGRLFRFVDASRPGGEDVGVDQLVQASVEDLRRVRARSRHQGSFRRQDHWASFDSWATSAGSRCSEMTLRQVTHLASAGHSVAELRHIMGRSTDVGTQDVLVLRGRSARQLPFAVGSVAGATRSTLSGRDLAEW